MHRQVNFGTHGFWSQCVVDKIVSFGLHKERRDFFPETDIFLWDHHKVSSSWTTMKSRCSMFTCKCRLLFKLPLDRPLFCDVIFCFFTSGTSIFLIFWEFSFIPRVLYCVRVSVPSFTVFSLFLSSLFMCKYYLSDSQSRLQILGPGSDLNRCGVNPWKLPTIFTRKKDRDRLFNSKKSKYLEMTFFRTHSHSLTLHATDTLLALLQFNTNHLLKCLYNRGRQHTFCKPNVTKICIMKSNLAIIVTKKTKDWLPLLNEVLPGHGVQIWLATALCLRPTLTQLLCIIALTKRK